MDTPEVITVFQETENGVVFQLVEPNLTDSGERFDRSIKIPRWLNNRKIIFTIILPLLLVFSLFQLVNISQADNNLPVMVSNSPQPSSNKVDSRALALQYYLASQNSPLKDYADQLVSYADQNGLDWKLLPSIAAVESKFGKVIPYGKNGASTSYNAWGWGVYQGKSVYFDSWEDAIAKVSAGLKTQFINDGLTTPEQINQRYSSNSDWGGMVDYYEKDLNQYYQAFEAKFGSQISSYNNQVEQTNAQNRIPFTLVTP